MTDASFIGTVGKHQHSRHKVFIGPPLHAHLPKGGIISIQYGLQTVQAQIVRIENKDTIILSSNLWRQLSIPFKHRLHFRWDEQTLVLGPLVGILTTGTHANMAQPIGTRTALFRRYLLAQKDVHASYFIFGPHDISWETRRIRGIFLRKTNEKLIWKQFAVPFPQVVFDKVPNRTREKSKAVTHARTALKKAGVKIFNPGFFNKWDIHQKLAGRRDVEAYIPETYFNPTPTQLSRLLQKYNMIYLKPAGGSLGLGIVQLLRHPKQGIISRYRRGHQNQVKNASHLQQVLQQVGGTRHLNRYIAQQGIPLIQIHNRPIDFRVHTNKNKQGEWKITAIAAKIAGKGSVTTHMRTGGKVLSYQEAIKQCFPKHRQEDVLNELEKVVLLLSQAIEESLPEYIGELGFDIGIDRSGHPWMFEANSKPGRHVFVHASMKKSDYMTRRMILDYSLYLAEFTTGDVKT